MDQFKMPPIEWEGDPIKEIQEAWDELEKKLDKKAKEQMDDLKKLLLNKHLSDEEVYKISRGLIDGSIIFVKDANGNIYILDKERHDYFELDPWIKY